MAALRSAPTDSVWQPPIFSPRSAAIVTVPRAGKGWQPLCAVYRREFANAAEEALQARRYKIDALFHDATTQIIGEHELESAGFFPEMFRNLNTREDLATSDSRDNS